MQHIKEVDNKEHTVIIPDEQFHILFILIILSLSNSTLKQSYIPCQVVLVYHI